ncbi:LysR family transcriptional regulator [Trinickia dinghuensis]|uniref:LysR family transcriptional regulator n=1 Tax=Trinickia dinghuensis TaxID=2291023 RepID=A0A3D8JZI4_9BURK|nr:LysR family transcriptional regulator [Trinickia dinghuensis]RDU97771.1 LysR family transcriptional regulator [Trinickia dinghuensis]
MDRLESMAIFARVVERGSFAAAAEDFRLTGTMVGHHVRALETRLGGRLLNRTTRRQSLTELGAQYYERCRLILAEVRDAEALGAELHGEARGRLRVLSPVSFGVHVLAPACIDYRAEHPNVEIDLVVSDRALDLVDEGFDIAIRIGDLPDSSLVARRLRPYRSVVCAAPSYLARHGAPSVPTDLSRHQCLGLAHPVASRQWRLHGPEGEVVVPVSLVFSANNGEALRMAALSGLGIVMQPEILLADDLRDGRLVLVLPDYEPAARPMHLLMASDRKPPAKIGTFADFVVKRFGGRATSSRRVAAK